MSEGSPASPRSSPLVGMTFSAMAAKVLYAAAEMRIPDLLAASGQTAEELARQT
jgi:hypothetical protein